MWRVEGERSPGGKLFIAILIAAALAIPIFMVWFLVYDRQSQSQQASASITEGWGGPQVLAGPVLVIPYRATATETVIESGQSVTRSRQVMRELSLAPETIELSTHIRPERRKRSIYEAVVYDATMAGKARFAFPPDLARHGVAIADMDLGRAELRFGLSDPKGQFSGPGYWVITPLAVTGGGYVLINRGFVPQQLGQNYTSGADAPLETNVGFLHPLNPRHWVKASAFIGLSDGGPRFGASLGFVQWF